jgi:hypothetical protein
MGAKPQPGLDVDPLEVGRALVDVPVQKEVEDVFHAKGALETSEMPTWATPSIGQKAIIAPFPTSCSLPFRRQQQSST